MIDTGPVLDGPGPACADRLLHATNRLLQTLYPSGTWLSKFTSNCDNIYATMSTPITPGVTLWLALTTVHHEPQSTIQCKQIACRQTDLGPLNWGTGQGGFSPAPAGESGTGLAYAGLERTMDGERLTLFEWLTYQRSLPIPTRPNAPQALADALLTAAPAL
jgi:hypothetical protein